MINVRTLIEAVSAPTVGVILHIIVVYFIFFPFFGVDIGFSATVKSLTPLLPVYIIEVYCFRSFFIWWHRKLDNRKKTNIFTLIRAANKLI